MNSDVVVFSFGSTNVRTLTVENETFFRASDVASALCTQTHGLLQRVPKDEIRFADVVDAAGKTQEVALLSEPGMYRAVLRSNKPEAEKFIRWVTREVLPSIRKQGYYLSEALKEQLAEQHAELARKEQVILQLQRKKGERPSKEGYVLVPHEEPCFEGHIPKVVFHQVLASELSEEQRREANMQHSIKTMVGILRKNMEQNGTRAFFDAFYEVLKKVLPE